MIHRARIAGRRTVEGRKLRVMEIGSMPRRYGTPDRQTGGQQPWKVRIEPPSSSGRAVTILYVPPYPGIRTGADRGRI